MNPTSAHLVHARALPDGLPTDIQFMPPGQHTITCSAGGTPKSITANITAATATLLERDRHRMATAAARNRGDLPYIDLNHNDEEAAARVTQIYWAGEDPISGGVRARVEWTAAGESALRGKLYRRFSPSFLVDPAGNIVGLGNENLGGLVNRAAFKTIQPVMAKSAALSELARSALVSEDEPFFLRVAEVMESEGISEKHAWASVLKKEPELWLEHIYNALGLDPEQAARLDIKPAIEAMASCMTPDNYSAVVKVLRSTIHSIGGNEFHPFMCAVRATAKAQGLDMHEAAQRVCAKQPELYTAFRKGL